MDGWVNGALATFMTAEHIWPYGVKSGYYRRRMETNECCGDAISSYDMPSQLS